MIFFIFFLILVILYLSVALYLCKPVKPVEHPIVMADCMAFLEQRNTPDFILRNISFVGHNYRFVHAGDFRLCSLRSEYEELRSRIRGLAEYLDSEHSLQDKERQVLLQQLAIMYAYLEIMELRCINQSFLQPITLHEEKE